MLRLATSFILGYHGCEATVAERLLSGEAFRPSDNDYDWLGPGIYFWEANPRRGLEFFDEGARRSGKNPTDAAVVGAVVELGLCLDLTTSVGTSMMADAYLRLDELARSARVSLPRNSDDLLRRNLDCAVIRYLHEVRSTLKEPRIDSVRGVFVEGDPIYPGAGVRAKTHVQICVCNPDMIRGIFRVPRSQLRTV
ncbi:MAG: hypothetical protein AB7P02_15535 [Alphaproteobacteria bacterium]